MVDPRDLKAQGDPETVISLPGGESLVGLYIVDSGHGSTMLGIREDELGRPVACAITNELRLDTKPHSRYRDDADYHKGAVGE